MLFIQILKLILAVVSILKPALLEQNLVIAIGKRHHSKLAKIEGP